MYRIFKDVNLLGPIINKMQSYINIRGREIIEGYKSENYYEGLIRELIEFKLEVDIIVNQAFMNDTTF